jgi:2-dehydro-3-deoxyphosphogluconate aldolase/(4S)-4-hydroxy-2-oxoglutarate aldolase
MIISYYTLVTAMCQPRRVRRGARASRANGLFSASCLLQFDAPYVKIREETNIEEEISMLNTYNPQFNRAYDEIVKKLDLSGIVPLIKIENTKNALPLAGALIAADMRAMEITFRTGAAQEVLRLLTSKCPDLVIGAGTVIDTRQVQEAVSSGAKYVITPSFNPAVVDRCIEIGIPVFPGCSTASDIEQAYSRGLRVVKYFPSELLGGVEMLKALSGPYPFIRFIPTGGINCDNLEKYVAFPKVLCCGGTFIAEEDDLENGRFENITRKARDAVDKVIGLKLDHIAINTDKAGAAEIMKAFSRLGGVSYIPQNAVVSGIEAVSDSGRQALGYIVYSSPNLERCLWYLGNRGFKTDERSVVTNGNQILEAFLVGNFGGFEIKLIKR